MGIGAASNLWKALSRAGLLVITKGLFWPFLPA
jgi:hypothetical protein